MPISIVVGGQFGSEGKGKVAHWLAQDQDAAYAIRVGGSNSGHTVIDESGNKIVLQHLPTSALLDSVISVIPSGAYIDQAILLREIHQLELSSKNVMIHPFAVVVDEGMRMSERESGLIEDISSTGRGIGIAVSRRAMRDKSVVFAKDTPSLRQFVNEDLDNLLSTKLRQGKRILVEGTQGFGLSLLHGGHYPFATSRDTSAAGALSESGLSPLDVDCVALVLRTFPIRVAGNSGPLKDETDWDFIKHHAGAPSALTEFTTVTKMARRVAKFDPDIVRRAIDVNRPNLLFLNHADYLDFSIHENTKLSDRTLAQVEAIEALLDFQITHIGTGPSTIALHHNLDWSPRKLPKSTLRKSREMG